MYTCVKHKIKRPGLMAIFLSCALPRWRSGGRGGGGGGGPMMYMSLTSGAQGINILPRWWLKIEQGDTQGNPVPKRQEFPPSSGPFYCCYCFVAWQHVFCTGIDGLKLFFKDCNWNNR